MDFSWTDEQLEFKKTIVEFAQKELNDDILERDKESSFSRENWLKCAKMGIQGLVIPEEYGGVGLDLLTAVLIMEGFGYGCRDNGLAFALNSQMWSVQPTILEFGSQAQKENYLAGLCRGELIGAFGMTEPDSGSDAFSLRTQAIIQDGGYILNGTKTMVTFAPIADFVIVFASSDPDLGQWGVSTFVVDKDTPGFRVSGSMDKMGLRTAPIGEVIFEDCFVPEANRIGPEGAGPSIFNSSLEWERSFILASQLGTMARQLEQAIQYANDRKQFGQSIGKFQSVSNRIADMKLRLETARLLTYKVAWLKSQGKSVMMDAALAKLYLSESFVESSFDAIRTFGGYGYMTEFEVERDFRDAIGGTLYGGTADIQRKIIARLLNL
jgi:alkylation response protein AidB-like acyl-CoA dehydrogenase